MELRTVRLTVNLRSCPTQENQFILRKHLVTKRFVTCLDYPGAPSSIRTGCCYGDRRRATVRVIDPFRVGPIQIRVRIDHLRFDPKTELEALVLDVANHHRVEPVREFRRLTCQSPSPPRRNFVSPNHPSIDDKPVHIRAPAAGRRGDSVRPLADVEIRRLPRVVEDGTERLACRFRHHHVALEVVCVPGSSHHTRPCVYPIYADGVVNASPPT